SSDVCSSDLPVEERERRVVERLLAARADDDLGLLVLDAVIEPVAIADGATELGDAGHRSVLAEVLIDRRVCRGLDRRGRGEVRFAGAEIDDLDTFAPQSIDGGGDLHRGRA